MKRIIVFLICFVGAIFLPLALEKFFPPPYKTEVVETWESKNTPFKIRVNKHIERGGFMPVLGGAYYDFQSFSGSSDDWCEIMTFRHDDPIEIPKDKVHFADDKVASVFMGWMYAVTTDGGENWRKAEIKFPANDNKCFYNCIKDLEISANGTGEIKLNLVGNPKDKLTVLETVDFGKTWREK